MLTKQEHEWLETRKNICTRCYKRNICRVGKKHGYNTMECCYWDVRRPSDEGCRFCWADFKGVALFEARVAALLARNEADRTVLRPNGCSWWEKDEAGKSVLKMACPPHRDIDNCPGLAMCSLYLARVAVEQ